MRKGGGHAKGSDYERDVCRRLSRWVTNGEKDDVYWRSAMSGGMATRRKDTDSFISGDICAVREEGFALLRIFVIECKRVNDLHLHTLPYDRQSNIFLFWRQACTQARRERRQPLLIARQDRFPELVGLHPRAFSVMQEVVVNPDRRQLAPHFVEVGKEQLVLVDAAEFWRWFEVKHLEGVTHAFATAGLLAPNPVH